VHTNRKEREKAMTKYQLHTLLSFIEYSNDCAIYAARDEQDSEGYKHSNDMRKLLQKELFEMVAGTSGDSK
jgi:hypothetical protein